MLRRAKHGAPEQVNLESVPTDLSGKEAPLGISEYLLPEGKRSERPMRTDSGKQRRLAHYGMTYYIQLSTWEEFCFTDKLAVPQMSRIGEIPWLRPVSTQ
jgi:hypothetical protein